MPDFEARCAVLTRENDTLRERVTSLEDALGLTSDAPPLLGLTPIEGQMLGMLVMRGFVRKEAFMVALYENRPDADDVPDAKIIDVLICKLRDKLKAFDITIETKWGEGYFIPKDAKPHAREILGGNQAQRKITSGDAPNARAELVHK